jgi:hypothetical protein
MSDVALGRSRLPERDVLRECAVEQPWVLRHVCDGSRSEASVQ